MKVLFIGLGSIGQRHLRNLRHLYGDDVEVLAFRVRGSSQTFSDQMEIIKGVRVEERYQVRSYDDLQKALSASPDVVFVTNITSRHIECALEAVRAGCHVFLEKPVSDRTEGVKTLIEEAERKQVTVFSGFQFRYHVCLLKLKECLSQGLLGNVLSVQMEMGERLSEMHPYENYKDTYMARRDMGGGVILNQQIHELDYLQWLFGRPQTVYARCGRSSDFKLDVEDCCDALYRIPYKGRIITAAVHADFVQSPPVRRCKVIGDQAGAQVDLLKNELSILRDKETVKVFRYPGFKRNDMFLSELKDFMEGIQKKQGPAISLREGAVSLIMALGEKSSDELGQAVELNYEEIMNTPFQAE